MQVSSSPSPSLIFHPITTLRQYRCPATAILLFCYGNIVVLLSMWSQIAPCPDNIPQRGVSFSDLICIFAMPIVGFSCFFLQH